MELQSTHENVHAALHSGGPSDGENEAMIPRAKVSARTYRLALAEKAAVESAVADGAVPAAAAAAAAAAHAAVVAEAGPPTLVHGEDDDEVNPASVSIDVDQVGSIGPVGAEYVMDPENRQIVIADDDSDDAISIASMSDGKGKNFISYLIRKRRENLRREKLKRQRKLDELANAEDTQRKVNILFSGRGILVAKNEQSLFDKYGTHNFSAIDLCMHCTRLLQLRKPLSKRFAPFAKDNHQKEADQNLLLEYREHMKLLRAMLACNEFERVEGDTTYFPQVPVLLLKVWRRTIQDVDFIPKEYRAPYYSSIVLLVGHPEWNTPILSRGTPRLVNRYFQMLKMTRDLVASRLTQILLTTTTNGRRAGPADDTLIAFDEDNTRSYSFCARVLVLLFFRLPHLAKDIMNAVGKGMVVPATDADSNQNPPALNAKISGASTGSGSGRAAGSAHALNSSGNSNSNILNDSRGSGAPDLTSALSEPRVGGWGDETLSQFMRYADLGFVEYGQHNQRKKRPVHKVKRRNQLKALGPEASFYEKAAPLYLWSVHFVDHASSLEASHIVDPRWLGILSQRGGFFFTFLKEYIRYVRSIIDKPLWHLVPGYTRLVQAFMNHFDLVGPSRYSLEFKQCSIELLCDPTLLNDFVQRSMALTNAYDLDDVHELLEVFDDWLRAIKRFHKRLPPTFNIDLFYKAMAMLLETTSLV
eukprot:Rmarinus@m.26570